MRWFKKKKPPETEAIAAFWQWWESVRADVAGAISAGGVSVYTEAFNNHVNAIHEDLQWELTPGQGSAHALVVSPGGKPTLRAVAARWLAAAPSPDATWEYAARRVADLQVFTSTMVINDQKLELDQLRYGITVDQEISQVDIVCYHPAFASLPDEALGQITFLSLDWTLGEDGVEIWVGSVNWTAAPLVNPKTPSDLFHAVEAIKADDQWVIMSGEKPDGIPLLATVAMPLRSARWPRFDLHIPVTLPYTRYNDGQFPVESSLDALRSFEDGLAVEIGANGALVAHETSGRQRVLHFYVDSQTNAQAQIEEQLRSWPEGRATVAPHLDPAFDGVSHLMR